MACVTLKRSRDFDLFNYIDKKKRRISIKSTSDTSSSSKIPTQLSPFIPIESNARREILLQKLKAEMLRMHNRRLIPNLIDTFRTHAPLLQAQSVTKSFENLVLRSPERDSSDSDSEKAQIQNACNKTKTLENLPLFNIQQVMRICDKILKERENEIRIEYDKTLNCKLAEQYESFLEFSKEHFHTRLSKGQLSYIS